MRNLRLILWLMATVGGRYVWDLDRGVLKSASVLGYEYARDGDFRYVQGPGISYRHMGDVVATRLLRRVRYHRVGQIAYTSVGRLVVYRRVAGIRTFRPSFKVL